MSGEIEKKPFAFSSFFLPLITTLGFLTIWHLAVRFSQSQLFPSPFEVAKGIVELIQKGILHKYIIASLYRVLWSFVLAILVGVPLGLLLGASKKVHQALGPLVQVIRPISPIAWIPLSILWFGLSEAAPMFLIFLASLFPIMLAAFSGIRSIQTAYVRAARNFGLSRTKLFWSVVFPGSLPQILTGIRIALGIAWLVVVAAEMIVVNPRTGGLGYLINDSRSAGRYDLVVAGMVVIGLIGLLLDLGIRQIENLEEVRWGYNRDE